MKKLLILPLAVAVFISAIAANNQTVITVMPQNTDSSQLVTAKQLGNGKIAVLNSSLIQGGIYGYHRVIDVAITNTDGENILGRRISFNNNTHFPQGSGAVSSIAITKDSGYVLTVYDLDQQLNTYVVLLIKLNSAGDLEWNSIITTPSQNIFNNHVKAIEDESGNFYVTCGGYGAMGVAKISPTGSFIWGKQATVTGNKNPLFDIALTHDGGVIVTAKGESHKEVLVFNYNGSVRWAKIYDNGAYNRLYVIKQLADGNFLAGGLLEWNISLTKMNPTGNILWEKQYQCWPTGFVYDFVEMPDRSVTVTGRCYDPGNIVPSYNFLLHTDTNGNMLEMMKLLQNTTEALPTITLDNEQITTAGIFTKADSSAHVYSFTASNTSHLCYAEPINVTVTDFTSRNTLLVEDWGLSFFNFTNDYDMFITVTPLTFTVTTSDYCQYMLSANQLPAPKAAFSIFPNPATAIATAQVGDEFKTGDEIRLYDAGGRLVKQTRIEGKYTNMDIAGLQAGVYTVQVSNGTLTTREKLVITN